MNWLIRLGQWWGNRRALRQDDLKKIFKRIDASETFLDGYLKGIDQRFIDMKESQKMSPTIVKELALIGARIDKLELYVGLKRDPKPQEVPGMAKIS